jgi:hypothetical protein
MRAGQAGCILPTGREDTRFGPAWVVVYTLKLSLIQYNASKQATLKRIIVR